tara:strand:+ start:1166 stop:1453 length:288 start_codon:yes stop_codon:yes gene_type:complete
MTILEVMERANSRDTNLVTAWIKDAFTKIQSDTEDNPTSSKQDINPSDVVTRDYDLPIGMVSLINVSILDTEDDNKYKKIRRLADEPVISEDTNP